MSSKAELLLGMDNVKISDNIEQESLDILKSSFSKMFDRDDWIDYAARLKKMGVRNSDILEKIPYKLSWLKKYVNPVFEQVTLEKEYLTKSPGEVTGSLEKVGKPFNPDRIVLSFRVTEINKSTRTFKGWGTVEMKDLDGEIISVEGLERIMPVYMRRGAPVQYGHSNKHVGRLKNYKIIEKVVKNQKLPAVEVTGQIFTDYRIDDLAWQAILLAMENDDAVLSIAGTPTSRPSIQCDETECFPRHDNLEVYEFSVVEYQRGSKGANPEAKVFEAVETEKEVTKAEKNPVLPAGHQLVDMMMSKSVSCQDRFISLIEAGKTESEAKASLYREMIGLNSTTKTEEKPPCPENTGEVKKGSVVTTDNQLTDVLKSIGDSLAGITEVQKAVLSSLQVLHKEKEKEEKEEKEEKGGDETKPKVPAALPEEEEKEKAEDETTPAMSLSKNTLAELAKSGYRLVAGPAPSVTQRKITAGLQEEVTKKASQPTIEEMREAVRTGTTTALARKHGHER